MAKQNGRVIEEWLKEYLCEEQQFSDPIATKMDVDSAVSQATVAYRPVIAILAKFVEAIATR